MTKEVTRSFTLPDAAAAEDYLDRLYEAGVTTHPIGIGRPGIIAITFDLDDDTIADIERMIDAVKAVIPGTEITCGHDGASRQGSV